MITCCSSLAAPRACLISITFYVPALVQGGGVRVNNEKVEDELHLLQEADLIDGRLVLIAAGKKNKMLVRVATEA